MGVAINQAVAGIMSGVSEIAVSTAAKVMTTGDIIFTAVGDIEAVNLYSKCITANGVGATTVQYSVTPTVGSITSISGVSASLASAAPGTLLTLVGDALATAPVLSASGVALATSDRGVIVPSGTIKLVVAVGPTTGTWVHVLRYRPLEPNAYVI